MAIAGNSIEAFHLRNEGGQLKMRGKSRVAPGMVTEDVGEALQKLLAGEKVWLWCYGTKLAELEDRWKEYHATEAA